MKKTDKSMYRVIEGILHAAKHSGICVTTLYSNINTHRKFFDRYKLGGVVILITLSIIVLSVVMLSSALETDNGYLFREYDEKEKIRTWPPARSS